MSLVSKKIATKRRSTEKQKELGHFKDVNCVEKKSLRSYCDMSGFWNIEYIFSNAV